MDYQRPIALFPLSCATLLPHTLQPFHIFEPRYRQMVEEALLAAGEGGEVLDAAPIAMATLAPLPEGTAAGPHPVLRPVVCVGRIVQHRLLSDGRHTIVLHGVARARIRELVEPSGRRLYRMARLAPLEAQRGRPALRAARRVIHDLLAGERLSRFQGVKPLLEWMERPDVPTHAVLELAAAAFVRDPERRYQMLAEPRPLIRARIVRDELVTLDRLLAAAVRQGSDQWPKGQSWN